MAKTKFERELLSTIVHLLIRHWKLTFLFVLMSGSATAFMHVAFPLYKASSVLYLRSTNTSPILSATAKITGYQMNDFSNTALNESYLKTLNSQSLLKFMVESLRRDNAAFGPISAALLEENGYLKMPAEYAVNDWEVFGEKLLGRISFKGKDQDLIEIVSISGDLATAAETANLFNRIASDFLFDYESKEISDIDRFLRDEVVNTQTRIDALSKDLDVFKGQQFMLNMASGAGSLIPQQSMGRLEEEREMVAVRIQEYETIIEKIQDQLGSRADRTPAGVEVSGDDSVPELRGRIVDKLRTLKEERESMGAKLDALQSRIRVLKANMKPQFEQKIYEFSKKLETEHYLYQDLKKQLSELNVYRISVGNRIRPYSLAKIESARHETPLSKKILLSVMISVTFLFFFLYMWEQLHPVVSGKSDLAALDITFLGSIPTVGIRPSIFSRLVVMLSAPFFPGAKRAALTGRRNRESVAFQFLRTRLLGLLKRQPGQCQIIAIASPTPGDGKSFICSNVAVLLGKCNLRVLVVDCDIVKNSMSGIFNVDSVFGLADLIANPKVKLEEVIIPSNSENVSFMASGSVKQSAEFFANVDVKPTFERLKKNFDVILLDTPAALARPESFMFSNGADHVLMVLNAYESKFQSVLEMFEGMGIEKGRPVYGVLNRHEEILQTAYYAYYIQAPSKA